MNETTKKSARRVELEAMNDNELRVLFGGYKLDPKDAQTRDDAIAAIELHEEEAAKGGAGTVAGVNSLQKSPQSPAKPKAKSKRSAGSAELTGEQIATVQKLWTRFSRDLPRAALSAGHHEIDKDQRKQAEDHGVPDGDYRVSGADWILTFEDGRLAGAKRGGPSADPASYATVPSPEG